MLTDRYGLAVSTASAAARDAYVEGCDLLMTVYPGASAAFERAIAADPDFALAHVANAVLQMANLPLETNVQFMTIMATKMPFVGRG